MQRLIALFLLVLLSLQSTWTLAGAYCQHETGLAVQHFGHHEYEHQADDDADDAKEPLSSVDSDCAACYASSIAALVGLVTNPKMAEGIVDYPWSPHYLKPPPGDEPERPDWAASA